MSDRPLLARLVDRIHPFDVMAVLLVGIGVLPLARVWVAVLWMAVVIGGAGYLRSGDSDDT